MRAGRIRPAKAEDVAAIGGVLERAYAPWRAQLPDLPDVAGGIAAHVASDLVWVAECERGICGMIVLVLAPSRATIANLAVCPDAAGQGLGRRLIATVEADCVTRGIPVCDLATHVAMKGNVALYERLGWRVVERSGSRVRMEKRL